VALHCGLGLLAIPCQQCQNTYRLGWVQRLDQAQKLARKLADKQQTLERSQQAGSAKSDGGKDEAREALKNCRVVREEVRKSLGLP